MSSRKNSVRFFVDFAKKEITGTKTSLNKAKCYGSPEYKELCKLVKAHPQFTIAVKEANQKKSKQTYKDLNFKFIESYISIKSNRDELTREYEAVKASAECLGRSAYPRVKRWFIERFSTKDKPFDVEEATREIENAAAQNGTAA